MSGAHELEPLPSSSPEWARQVQQRLRRLEGPSRSVRAGDWVLVSKGGVLTANRAGVPPVTLASAPEDDPGSAPRSVSGLPAVMPEDWWSQLVATITGFPGTLNDLGQYLDAQYYASTHGPGALLAGANMLWNPDFTGIESLAGGDDWEWDHTVYFDSSGSGAAADQGSAKTVCNGTRKVLRSNLVEVSEGQVLQLSVRCAAFGLTGGGVNLGITAYGADGSREEHVIEPENVVPADPTTDWYGVPVGAKTVVASGSWTVEHGVTAVRQYVDTSATAGTLWVDRGAFELGGLLSLLTRQVLWDDIAVLTRTAVTYVFGDGTVTPFSPEATAAMAAAFQRVLTDLGLTGPDKDMEQFWQSIWDGAIAAVVPKALTDVPGFFTAGWGLITGLWNYLFGRTGAAPFGKVVAGELGDAWETFVSFLKPANAQIPTSSRENFWGGIAGNAFASLPVSGSSTIGDALQKFLHPTAPTVPGWLLASAWPSSSTSVPLGSLYYVVTAVKDDIESMPSNEAFVYILFGPAEVRLTWTAVEGATEYRIYRGTKSRGWDVLVGTSPTNSFTNRAATIGPGEPPDIGSAAVAAVGSAQATAADTAAAVHNGWYGSGGTGDPTEAKQAVVAIKDTILAGYSAQGFSANGVWTRPENCIECIVVAIGAGVGGAPGQLEFGGEGGLNGGYVAKTLPRDGIPETLTISVGATEAATTTITGPWEPVVSSVYGSAGGIVNASGYIYSTSKPGRGGTGGMAGQQAGQNGNRGESSALALGGPGGRGNSASQISTDGSAGANVSIENSVPCGGSGGGGGGGGNGSSTLPGGRNGRNGGPGGFPGGGGGGGGAGALNGALGNGTPGNGGTFGKGAAWIIWRTGQA
ncbi:hypothetical protein [Mycobacterium sp. SMC-11]|uniref:hypothetical protein n=1 Tax=Mycobacterium sp. SMC-11 TaxID=3385969 RepID=UPI00390C50B9